MAAQRTLTERADTASDIDDTPTTARELLDRAQRHAANVAAAHFPELPVDAIAWDILTRAQRTAGATKYDPGSGEITISLTWDAYDSQGWEQFSSTVRHEVTPRTAILRFTRRRFFSGPEDKIQHPQALQALAEIQILVVLTLLLSIAMLSSLGLTPQLSEYLTSVLLEMSEW